MSGRTEGAEMPKVPDEICPLLALGRLARIGGEVNETEEDLFCQKTRCHWWVELPSSGIGGHCVVHAIAGFLSNIKPGIIR